MPHRHANLATEARFMRHESHIPLLATEAVVGSCIFMSIPSPPLIHIAGLPLIVERNKDLNMISLLPF